MSGTNYIFNTQDDPNIFWAGSIIHVGFFRDGWAEDWTVGPGPRTYSKNDLVEIVANRRAVDIIKSAANEQEDVIEQVIIDLQRRIHEQDHKCYFSTKNKRQIKKIIRKGKTRIERAKRGQKVS